ncbi:MAG TPA: YihY/virulence factor BrkB family protein [Frankiaceae bacterium]|nr:YihY/virulence factor BrkB family protein [Frankiaceae bacterium]
MTLTERLDRYQRKHRWAGFPLAVIYKFTDDQGPFLAALLTYYGFLSLFPLLLLLTSILGFLLQNDPLLQTRILDSALGQFPLIGSDLPRGRLEGSNWAVLVGLVGILYGGLGIAQAGQNAMNVIWAVPRNRRPNPIKSRLKSVILLLTVGLGVVATSALSGLVNVTEAFGEKIGVGVTLPAFIAAVVLNSGIFLLAFRIATVRDVSWREIAPGAIGAAVFWQILQLLGASYVKHTLTTAGATYGTFGLVLGLLAFIYLEALAVVLCGELNAVLARRLWPRALLTPFTDNVELTAADEHAYASYAEAQRLKGFERIDVSFRNRPARRRSRRPPRARR